MMTEQAHIRLYQRALQCAEIKGPDWSELTPEQRDNIRVVNIAHADYMRKLAEWVGGRGPMPALPGTEILDDKND